MKVKIIGGEFSVCQVKDASHIDLSRPFTFAAHTDEEISLVCHTEDVPGGTVRREDGWRMLRIEGQLDFALIGILSRIAGLLAAAGIAIFAVSTYDTDYVMVKEARFWDAVNILAKNGYDIIAV